MNTVTRVGMGLCVVLAGCTTPRFDNVATPAQYSTMAAPPSIVADGVTQRLVEAPPTPQWWHEYRSDALNALVDEALKNSPSLATAQATLKAAHEELRAQIGENLLPQANVGFSPSRQRALALPFLPNQTYLYNIFALEGQVSYRFDFFGASRLADRALANQVARQGFELDATRRAVAANVVIATINIAALQESLDAAEQLTALAEESAQQQRSRATLGSVSNDEALTADAEAANIAAQVPPLRVQLLALEHTQAVLLGRTPDQAPAPLALDSLHLPEQVPVAVPSELLRQRPDILAAQAAVRAAADAADAAAATLYPTLTLSAAYGRGGFDWSTFTSPAGAIWSVGASLTQPLFHGGALKARKREYADLFQASESEYRQTVLAAFENVADTLSSLEQDAGALEQSSRAAKAASQTQSDAVTRYQLGAIPWSASLAASQQYQNSRMALARARAARLADTAALFEAMGAAPAAGGKAADSP